MRTTKLKLCVCRWHYFHKWSFGSANELHEQVPQSTITRLCLWKHWSHNYRLASIVMSTWTVVHLLRGDDVILSLLANLKKFVPMSTTDMNSVAKSLINLEQIEFGEVSVNELLPFIHHSVKLKRMCVRRFKDVTKNEPLDLPMKTGKTIFYFIHS